METGSRGGKAESLEPAASLAGVVVMRTLLGRAGPGKHAGELRAAEKHCNSSISAVPWTWPGRSANLCPMKALCSGCGFELVALCTQQTLFLSFLSGVPPFIPQNLMVLPPPPEALCVGCSALFLCFAQCPFGRYQQPLTHRSVLHWRKVPSTIC